ncbi:hypothetical protein TWF730_003332 [Orbilia blumenaviensis]|uniref:Uncharacterized protein n=1 Tax=Orbilia blumenaviensis TaxID=1796055 RepID=A0AAV9U9E9_9PEZI
MTKNAFSTTGPQFYGTTTPDRLLSSNTPPKEKPKVLKDTDGHPPPENDGQELPNQPPQTQHHDNPHELRDLALAAKARLEQYIKTSVTACAEDIQSKCAEFEEKQHSKMEEDRFSAGQTTSLNDDGPNGIALLPKRLNPSVIKAPDPETDSEYDEEEDFRRFKEDINGSANNLKEGISHGIDQEKNSYLKSTFRRFQIAHAESPERGREEGENATNVFKGLVQWVNGIFNKA